MGANYLKKYYLDDAKLAQRARLEFYRELDTGRMIAFVGSMATQAFGYGSWDQLRLTFTALAMDTIHDAYAEQVRHIGLTGAAKRRLAGEKANRIRKIRDFHIRSADKQWNAQVGMSLMEEVLDAIDLEVMPAQWDKLKSMAGGRIGDWPLDTHNNLVEAMRAALADRFRQPRDEWRIDRDPGNPGKFDDASFDQIYNVPQALWRLGIRRFATPSYDFELERVSMLGDHHFKTTRDGSVPRVSPFERLCALRHKKAANFSWDLGSGRIRRSFADGWAIESDLLNRERIDRLIEFGVGTDDVDGHVMHLHGRACTPDSMIVTQRDYDNLYRREDLNKRPFESAKRMMMGGNPILFVGLGMTEPEINHDLHEFISNNPYQRVAPTFLLWSARAGKGLSPEECEAKRLDMLRRLGVLTIFDTDLLPTEHRDQDRVTSTNPRSDKEQEISAREDKLKKKRDGQKAGPERDLARSKLEKHKAHQHDWLETLGETTLGALSWEKADKGWREDLKYLHSCVTLLDRQGAHAGLRDKHFVDPTKREMPDAKRWRSMEGLIGRPAANKPIILWDIERAAERSETNDTEWIRKLALKCDRNIVCIIGSQGCGKGESARALAHQGHRFFDGVSIDRTMLINGCFSFDTDSLLDGVARFLASKFGQPIGPANEPPKSGRTRLFKDLKLTGSRLLGPRALVILNGSERFFDLTGRPLSAELDQLLSAVSRPVKPTDSRSAKVQWIIFGTERVRAHMEELGAAVFEFDDVCPGEREKREDAEIPSNYLNGVWGEMKQDMPIPSPLQAAVERYRANMTGRISGDGFDLRRAVFGAILDEGRMEKVFPEKMSSLAREMLRALAFIGLPAEREVLRLMPGLKSSTDKDFKSALTALIKAKMVLRARGYLADTNKPEERLVLHRSMLTELRSRFGIPLSEAKLSTAFNMSLYVAQPIDGDIPDHDIHEELGSAVDGLMGAYRHQKPRKDAFEVALDRLNVALEDNGCNAVERGTLEGILSEVSLTCGSSRSGGRVDHAEIAMLCGKRHVQSLRVALALIRSYYSTTGLLTLDSGDRLIREGRDGVLLEHSERLGDLIDAYGKSALARQSVRTLLGEEIKKEYSGEPADLDRLADIAFAAAFGDAEPFYPDELVWLHNERGVVHLAMGNLYEARRALDNAMAINRKWVERNDLAHNWRRIRINQLSVDIEMGDITMAERKCDEIRAVSVQGATLREDRLAIALVTGFQAWIEHLRGRIDPALAFYKTACEALSELGEVRAQAYFERLRANAMGTALSNERRATLDRALDLAESAVQMDLVHRLRIVLADTILFSKEPSTLEERQRANRYLEEAHVYSLHTEVHRVRLEAAMGTARARLFVSDFEGALRFAMDAMMIATRYGMTLRKITLRAVLAKIMAARGHPVTAEQLARTCIKMATRLRFQTAIDKAAQVIIDIPRISAAISRSDQTGRRNF